MSSQKFYSLITINFIGNIQRESCVYRLLNGKYMVLETHITEIWVLLGNEKNIICFIHYLLFIFTFSKLSFISEISEILYAFFLLLVFFGSVRAAAAPIRFPEKFILVWFSRKSMQNPQGKPKNCFFLLPMFSGSVRAIVAPIWLPKKFILVWFLRKSMQNP